MTNDRSSPGASVHRQEPQFDHLGPDTAFQDWIDLANDRAWMIAQETHHFDDPPRIWLEQYRGDVELFDITGRVWLHPEDIPAVIKKLSYWLKAYVECAREDAKRRPAPNWGNLLRVVETGDRPGEHQRTKDLGTEEP